jgi:hypothetical protein
VAESTNIIIIVRLSLLKIVVAFLISLGIPRHGRRKGR